ncbi:MAG: winged helix DNA-binding domain-containing protein [Defluviitaleaceae bacterium]|nr:winged helix DNA-binding domain-containing protein [Defluviitaleaceae bacterium]MCL2275346.1 winged helix DNA-binding domain-containing protein [Defluviitaleaceae bacterium]
MQTLTNRQARQFILKKQGLLGAHRFIGKQGALEYILQAGCIQFDPVDLHGQNAEILLHARVKNFTKKMLHDLLYRDRKLFDYPDKQLAIVPTAHWAYFERFRASARAHAQHFPDLPALEVQALAYIEAHGAVSSADLPIAGTTRWNSAIHWSGNWSGQTNAARAILEQLYSTGQLVIHHKKRTRKFYDLAARHIPAEILQAPDPLSDDFDHIKWRVNRRIGAIGLLWNRPSDAFLGIRELTTELRNRAFAELHQNGEIIPLSVEGINTPLFMQAQDAPLLDQILNNTADLKPRTELLSPLDCLLWDRKLIRALFNFHYTWEIYTPAHKRKYGAYTLPVLHGESFIARAEPDKDIWYEANIKPTKKQLSAINGCLKRFERIGKNKKDGTP